MGQFTEGESTREEIKYKLCQNFGGKVVRKEVTKKSRKEQNLASKLVSENSI